jgi:diketogulonate reductase-like aldo/keto reductase
VSRQARTSSRAKTATTPSPGRSRYVRAPRAARPHHSRAAQAGYRHIDSAEWYENETETGRAIRDFCARAGVPRSAIFYTTKLKLNNGRARVARSIQRSLDACGLGYIDLYLIHGPIGGRQMRRESWEACVQARKDGVARSVGISTFGVRQMEELLEDVPGEVPAVNQVCTCSAIRVRLRTDGVHVD